ncbi:MAG: prolyl oligopeptidase family serine peptidase [Spirochaetales bacterium]|nr:prolyl oligopeptidase family serine peptidase [Spirochaetales bacterium]
MNNFIKVIIKITFILILLSVTSSCYPEYANSQLVIKDGVVVLKDGSRYSYQLLRLTGKTAPSYAVYFPGEKTESVLLTRPYIAINWTGEEIDSIQSNPVSVDEMLESSMIYIINGFPVLNVFARFYSGGDIQNDIDDITAGIDFLSKKTDKIGISGSSWGGFEAIYGAVKSTLKPIVGVAYYPPSDMESWYNWTISTGETFFNPYKARIETATNGNFSKWSHDYIVENLETDFLLIHAPQDTLVPVEQSVNLANLSDRVNLFIQQRATQPLSHGEMLNEYTIPIDITLSTSYLMYNLTDGDILTIADSRALADLDDGFAKDLLRDNRIQIYESNEDRILSNEQKEELLR